MTDHTHAAANQAEDPTSAQVVSPLGSSAEAPQTLSAPGSYYTFVPYPAPIPAPPVVTTLFVPPPAPVVTGIPPGLAALLCHTGPWTANVIYSVAPTGPVAPVEEITPAPEWYVIYRGRFVSVFDQ
ncbi:hypothetical protein DFH09DRAFT_1317331 [Mycena vulgaris]|nr:hypothetical protein DFH09DRAFT_1317331 [Mycena vulgaris]